MATYRQTTDRLTMAAIEARVARDKAALEGRPSRDLADAARKAEAVLDRHLGGNGSGDLAQGIRRG